MRGVIAAFDAEASVGTIRRKDGKLHPFARSSLMRRSREPQVAARVVWWLRRLPRAASASVMGHVW